MSLGPGETNLLYKIGQDFLDIQCDTSFVGFIPYASSVYLTQSPLSRWDPPFKSRVSLPHRITLPVLNLMRQTLLGG